MAVEPEHALHELDKRRQRSYGVSMIEQVAKLGSDAEYIKRDVGELKKDLREATLENRREFREVRDELSEMRERQERDFRIIFGALVTTTLGIAGVIAKGFGWF